MAITMEMEMAKEMEIMLAKEMETGIAATARIRIRMAKDPKKTNQMVITVKRLW